MNAHGLLLNTVESFRPCRASSYYGSSSNSSSSGGGSGSGSVGRGKTKTGNHTTSLFGFVGDPHDAEFDFNGHDASGGGLGVWLPGPPMVKRRSIFQMVVAGGDLYAVGGDDDDTGSGMLSIEKVRNLRM